MEKIWDVPSFDEDISSDEALELIDQFSKEANNAFCEGKTHPYLSREHRQHQTFLDYRDKLFQAAYPVEEEGEVAEVAEGVEATESLRAEAEKEMDALESLGFRRDEIPADIMPFQVRALRMQRLNVTGKFEELLPQVEQELRALGASGMGTFRSFASDPGLSAEEKSEHLELILKRIYKANKERKNGF